MDSISSQEAQLRSHFDPPKPQEESEELKAMIKKLNMIEHSEGGYFVETDRDALRIPNSLPASHGETRSAMTTIYYLLTPKSPLGVFHRNKARTVHTLHKGRAGYTNDDALPEEERWTGKARVEIFTVGHDVLRGERLQWIVDGGKYKSSFLLPDREGDERGSREGLLISETVVPGFEFADHDFLEQEQFEMLVAKAQAAEMRWMVKKPK